MKAVDQVRVGRACRAFECHLSGLRAMAFLENPARNPVGTVAAIIVVSLVLVAPPASSGAQAQDLNGSGQSGFDTLVPQALQPGRTDVVNITIGGSAGDVAMSSDLALPGPAQSIGLNFLGGPGAPGRFAVRDGATLTIESGANIDFDENGRFDVGRKASGSVLMNGGEVSLSSVGGRYSLLGVGNDGTGTFTQNAGTVRIQGSALDVGFNGGSGTYDMRGGEIALTPGATIYVGEDPGASGTLSISGNSRITSSTVNPSSTGTQIFIGTDEGVGRVVQNGAGSLVSIDSGANAFWFGHSFASDKEGGRGTYELQAGTFEVKGRDGPRFGTAEGGTGEFIQSGGAFSSEGGVIFGERGTGIYTLSGGTAAFDGGLRLAVRAGSSGTIDQTGGTLAIGAGSDLYLGGGGAGIYNLTGGTLAIGGSDLRGRAPGGGSGGSYAFNLGGGTIRVTGSDLTTSVNATLTGGSTSAIDTNGLNATWNGVLSGGGGLAKAGTGTLTLASANTFTGGVSLQGGTLALGLTNALSGNALATMSGAALDLTGLSNTDVVNLGAVSGDGTINLGVANLVTTIGSGQSAAFSGTINSDGWPYDSEIGTFTKTGAGDLVINGSTMNRGESFIVQGSMTQSGGTTAWSNINPGSGAGANGTLNVSGGTLTVNVGMRVGDFGGTGFVNQTGGTVRLEPTCSDTSRCVSLNVGNQGGTGTYTISGGSLILEGGAHSIGRTTGARASSSGTLNIGGTGLVEVRPSAFSSGFLVIGDRDNSTNDGTGTLNQTGGTLRIVDTSRLYLGGYGGSTYNLTGGALEIGGTSLQGLYGGGGADGSYAFNLGGGTIRVTGSNLTTSVNATLTGGRTSAIDTNGLNATWNGVFSGGGGLAKAGAGTLTLASANTFTGGVSLQGGTLALGLTNALSGNALATSSGAVLDLTGLSNTDVVNLGAVSGAGTINLGVANLVTTIGSGHSAAFSGTINSDGWPYDSEIGTFTKTGAGDLVINGSTMNRGESFIVQGSMTQSGGTTTWSNINVGSGTGANGTLNVSGGSLTLNVGMRVGDFGGTGLVNQTGGTVRLEPTCSDNDRCASLNIGNQGGTGTYTISGGSLILEGGSHTIGRNAGTRPVSSGTLNISGTGLVEVRPYGASRGFLVIGDRDATAQTSTGVINQTGGTLRIVDTSELYLGGYGSGTYNLNGGTLEIGADNLRGLYANNGTGSYAFNLGGGTIRVTGSDLATSVDATLTGGSTSTVDTNGLNATWGGAFSGGGGLAKAGAGTLTLASANTFTGGVSLQGGTLALGVANALSGNALSAAGGAILDLTTLTDSDAVNLGAVSGGGTINLGVANLVTSVAGGQMSAFSGILNSDGWPYDSEIGTFTKTGAGDLVINGSTMNRGESFIVQGSMTQSGGTTAWSSINVGSGTGANGTLNVSGGSLTLNVGMRVGDFGGTGFVNQTGGTVRLEPTCSDNDRCASLNIGNQGGTGTYTISGGSLILEGGSHTIGRNAGSRPVSSGTLNISGTGLVEVRPSSFSGGFLVIGDRDATAQTSTGVINQTGGTLRIVDTSELYLGGYGSGTYNLDGGTLEIGADNLRGLYANNGTGSYAFNLGGGTIRVTGSNLTTSVNATLTGGSTSAIDTNGLNATWNGVFSGGGGLAKAGAGTLTLASANTFTGGVSLQGGTLALGVANALNGNAVATSAGSVFDITGLGAADVVRIGALSGGGTVQLGDSSLTSTINAGQSATFSGTLSSPAFSYEANPGQFIKAGSGNLTINGSTMSRGQAFIAGGSMTQSGGTSNWSTLNVGRGAGADGALNVTGGSLTLAVGLRAGASGGRGTITQTGGTLRMASGSTFHLGGPGGGVYDLNGGALEIGGTSLQGLSGGTGSYAFTLGGGTIRVTGSDLATSVNATLTGGRTSTVDTNGFNARWGGVFSGGGSLRKAGQGTLTLPGVNTYSGTTYLAGGTVRAVEGALGTGALVFEAASTYAFAGSFTLAKEVTFGPGAVGSFQVDAGSTGTLGGRLSGTGGLAKTGLGTLVLAGTANSYSGQTRVRQGTLIVGATGALPDASELLVDTGASFQLRGVAQKLKKLEGTGNIVLGEASTLDIATDTSDSVFDGNLSGTGGVSKSGGGTLTFNGVNDYTGPTSIDSGSLVVNGEVTNSPITVNPGGSLAGRGRVNTVNLQGGANIMPGNSPGTLTVIRDITFRPGSTYVAEIENGISDNIVVQDGVATIMEGSNLSLQLTGTPTLGEAYTILEARTATGGSIVTMGRGFTVSSNFTRPLLEQDVTYSPSAVTVTYDGLSAPWSTVVSGANAGAAADGVQSLGLENSLYEDAVFLTEDRIDGAFALLSGEINASAKSVLINDSRFVRTTVFDRLATLDGQSGAATRFASAPLSYASSGGAGDPEPVRTNATVWATGFGSWGSSDGGVAGDLDRDSSGVFTGADVLLGSWRVGVLGGYSHTGFSVDSQRSSGDTDAYHAALYAGTSWHAVNVRGGAAYSWDDVSSSRIASFPTTQTLKADYDAGTTQLFGEVGYGVDAGPVGFEPFAGLAYVNLNTDGFTETGGVAALTSQGDATDITYSTLGLRGSASAAIGAGMNATVQGMVGWRHMYSASTPTSAFAFAAGGTPFTVAGVPFAKDTLLLDAGLNVSVRNSLSLGAAYSGEFGDGSADQSVGGTLAWTF
ncbi:autotransporter-associated beta strand repeat-containing protein [Amorphus orientalis]|uniref:Autotransporter-associated beta strand protein n=1 Tax=Amorphus orientalis TaxID=649198 RepID=A0AAE3VR36_9HYPH|nr:autotransporter domain-containing protein [Amorphus orientalis]MDQ0316300.1 autotransporter-associated beta strand protein [Amorphus orientalis]